MIGVVFYPFLEAWRRAYRQLPY